MPYFRDLLASGRVIFFDGGLGTMLQARGLPPGESPEQFGLIQPEAVRSIHKEYALAGADVITTNSFGGTRFKLPGGLNVMSVNKKMAEIARLTADEAAAEVDHPVFVAGSVGPCGLFLPPLGELSFHEMVEAFREQIRGLMAGGADLILAETQFDLAEARAIVYAARLEGDMPLGVSMTYENGVSLTGTSPEVFAASIANMPVDFMGINCGAGPLEMCSLVERLGQVAEIPLLAQPNAGLPNLVDGKTVFSLESEPFATATATFVDLGARLLGGCCGTTPKHIRALRRLLEHTAPTAVPTRREGRIILTSRSSLVRIGLDEPVRTIGERINPTGKKQLAAELAARDFTTALRFADEQALAGAEVLDVNVGAPHVDEASLLPDLSLRLTERHTLPLSIDSSDTRAIAAALAVYPASPLVNSINGEAGSMDRLGPLCRDFGAPFILLPLKGKNLPETAAQRIAIIENLLRSMEDLHIPKRLAMVDVLALTISAAPLAAKECLAVIRYCAEDLKLPTSMGLSNISFGLPARELINSSFLSMAAGAGLSACIANPSSRRFMEELAASNLLTGKDKDATFFLDSYVSWTSGTAPGNGGVTRGPVDVGKVASLAEAVILGRKEEIPELVRLALASGAHPLDIVNERLIPAINEVGRKYTCREYFLPQLIRSAESMQAAFALLRPLLENALSDASRPVVIMATVEGDIHDIGKNIVNLMLENHGFEVIDLGKDVKAIAIVEAARKYKAPLIGLSALMTTTMVRMEDTLALLKEEGLTTSVMVGGAVVTADYARRIGAFYAQDAVEAVRVATDLLRPDFVEKNSVE